MESLTIGIPVYNEEKFLSKALRSLVSQKMKNWKAIISDNCSTDRTVEIARKYALKDPRFTIFQHEQKIPAFDNFLHTLSQAESEYFVWMGGHDIFCSSYFDMALKIFSRNKNVSMVYPDSEYIDILDTVIGTCKDNLNTVGLKKRQRMSKVAQNLHFCTAIHGIFKRDILRQLPFKKVIGCDQLLLFAAAYYGEFYEIPVVGIKMRQVRNESYEEAKIRWEKERVFSSDDQKNPHASLAAEYIKFVWKLKEMGFFEKVSLSLEMKKLFQEKFEVRSTDMLRSF